MTNVPELDWTYRLDPAGAEWEIKGRVLAAAFWPKTNHRFLVEEVRTRVPHPTRANDHVGGVTYRLRDAATVTDADVRAGRFSQIVCRSDDLAVIAAHVAKALA